MAIERVISSELVESMSIAKGLTVPEGSKRFIAQAQNGDVRVCIDGTTCTDTTGFLLSHGNVHDFVPSDPDDVSVKATSNTPKLYITYFGSM